MRHPPYHFDMKINAVLGLALSTVLLVLASAPAQAQQPALPGEDPELVDRVVAVVGDSVILLTQVRSEIETQAAQGQTFPSDPDSLRAAARAVLDELVNLQLILQAAQKDSALMASPALDPELVNDSTEARIDAIRGRFGTEEAFEAALEQQGLSLEEYRETVRTTFRQGMIQQAYLQRNIRQGRPVVVSEQEMREVFGQQRTALGTLPERLNLIQVRLEARPSEEAWEAARVTADSLYSLALEEDADFAALARESSDDGSASEGGSLGWFRRGAMVREFEDVAFTLGRGEVSAPVRSQFGWHVIKVERVRPGEVNARHILITPETTPADLDRAEALADSLVREIRSGADARAIAEEWDSEQAQRATPIPTEFEATRQQINQSLPPGYTAPILNTGEGEVTDPFLTTYPGLGQLWALVYVDEITPPGELTFEEARPQVRQFLEQQKRIERLFTQLRESTHVEIRF